MKKIIAALLFSISPIVYADTMVTENKQGGVIILAKDPCPIETEFDQPLYIALTTTKEKNVPGCWYFKDMKVTVFWFTETQGIVKSEYSPLDFEFVPSDREKNNS